jgi:hypothetical protein
MSEGFDELVIEQLEKLRKRRFSQEGIINGLFVFVAISLCSSETKTAQATPGEIAAFVNDNVATIRPILERAIGDSADKEESGGTVQ